MYLGLPREEAGAGRRFRLFLRRDRGKLGFGTEFAEYKSVSCVLVGPHMQFAILCPSQYLSATQVIRENKEETE